VGHLPDAGGNQSAEGTGLVAIGAGGVAPADEGVKLHLLMSEMSQLLKKTRLCRLTVGNREMFVGSNREIYKLNQRIYCKFIG
jgi:hypothetical protein